MAATTTRTRVTETPATALAITTTPILSTGAQCPYQGGQGNVLQPLREDREAGRRGEGRRTCGPEVSDEAKKLPTNQTNQSTKVHPVLVGICSSGMIEKAEGIRLYSGQGLC